MVIIIIIIIITGLCGSIRAAQSQNLIVVRVLFIGSNSNPYKTCHLFLTSQDTIQELSSTLIAGKGGYFSIISQYNLNYISIISQYNLNTISIISQVSKFMY